MLMSSLPRFTMSMKSFATSDAPPISPPSMSGMANSAAAFCGFTLPPYRIARCQRDTLLLQESVHRLRLLRRRVAPGADRPDRFVGQTPLPRSTLLPAPFSCRATTSSVLPASRSCSVSPTQRIGVMPAACTARELRRRLRVASRRTAAGARNGRRSRSGSRIPPASPPRLRRYGRPARARSTFCAPPGDRTCPASCSADLAEVRKRNADRAPHPLNLRALRRSAFQERPVRLPAAVHLPVAGHQPERVPCL